MTSTPLSSLHPPRGREEEMTSPSPPLPAGVPGAPSQDEEGWGSPRLRLQLLVAPL